VRKPYTGIPLDKPHPLTGEKKYWLPYLRVRPAKAHTVMRSPLLAIVDSGSPYCLFREDIATAIGIRDITKGAVKSEIGSVRQGIKTDCYFHKIKIYVEEWIVDVTAGFTPHLAVPALLGRYGFFDQFLVTFNHSGNPPMLDISKIDRVM
jgi:hypothetical protein